MKNKAGNGLYFALNDDNGVEICEVTDNNIEEFIRKTVNVINRRKMSENKQTRNSTSTMANKKIIDDIKNAISYKIEWHARIYDDGCWWIDIERHPYGQIRFWVGYEDKRSGNSNGSLYTIYRLGNELRYSCEFKVKQKVADKIKSVYEALEKESMI